MLTKFESKSNRVKGLSFHPVRPWILASLHNGCIQLWDYRMGTLIDKFEEHEGPVRGVDFHRTQPLIVSGGDDYKVKVWDYKLRRCLFTLLGHLDYIRTVQFHNEYPWIVSASDDQTIRIWNWQSRSCVSVLTGHNHYVMCASFHPKDDLIVSASLDQTVRVWDTTGLRKKTVRSAAPSSMDDHNVVAKFNNELFGGNDAVVKYVMEGHERGVNWATFHPTLPLIISGADDRQVKLWRMNESKAWEVDTMRGHTNNVSCVLFHPRHELIVSNSEDKTVRVWDTTKRTGVQTFRRENDRFWILAAHPEQNLLAAGHDSGMTVFKLERERPAYDVTGTRCLYVKERYLRMYDFASQRDTPIVSLRRSSTSSTPGIGGGPRSLLFNGLNRNDQSVLIMSDTDGGSYDLVTFTSENTGNSASAGEAQNVQRGPGIAAVFIARDKFVVLDKAKQLQIRDLNNEVLRTVNVNISGIDGLFYAGTPGNVILRAEDRVLLYDLEARRVVSELPIARAKYVAWKGDGSMVAIISKHQVVLATKTFDHCATVNETVRVKGGAWECSAPTGSASLPKHIFVYTTANHVKYALPNGDRGIIRGLDAPVYVTRVHGDSLLCLDREGKMRRLEIDLVEASFKIALENRDYVEVMRLVRNSTLCGQAIISYLQEKGYPEVALHFVHDAATRFKLALACGNLQVALSVAFEVDDEESWLALGSEALRQGNFEVVEMAYQKTRQFEALSFLYLLTGQLEKLRKMLRIAELRGDTMSTVHNALYLGDVEERVAALEKAGQLSLAYLAAATHGLTELAERLAEALVAAELPVPEVLPNAQLLLPPTPICPGENWPYLAVAKSYMDQAADTINKAGAAASTAGGASRFDDEDEFRDAVGGGNWGDDDLFDDEEPAAPAPNARKAAAGGGVAWGDDDLDLSDDEPVAGDGEFESDFAFGGPSAAPGAHAVSASLPANGTSPITVWASESSHCADHFAAGSAESAIQLLNRQIGAVRLESVAHEALATFIGARGFLPGAFSMPTTTHYLTRSSPADASGKTAGNMPALVITVEQLLAKVKVGYRAFTSGEFDLCETTLTEVLHTIPLVWCATKNEADELKEMLTMCREYLLGIRLKSAMDTLGAAGEDESAVTRLLEVAAYFTHCKLLAVHQILALKAAMSVAFKNKNFINAASFAQRIMESPAAAGNEELLVRARKVRQKSEQLGRNSFSIDYDERNPFKVDVSTLRPIYSGSPAISCSFCGSTMNPELKGKVCALCGVGTCGLETVGLVSQTVSRKR